MWEATEAFNATCGVGGSSQSVTGSGTNIVQIRQKQNDCSFAYEIAVGGIVVPRTGIIERNQVTISGPMTIPIHGARVTENMIRGEGIICGDTLTATGSGRIAGTVSGGGTTVSLTCDVTSTTKAIRRK
jgi:hypothetical protein